MKKFFSYLNTECPLFIKKSSKITLVIATLAITIFITLKSSSISYAQNAFPTSYPNYNNYATNLFGLAGSALAGSIADNANTIVSHLCRTYPLGNSDCMTQPNNLLDRLVPNPLTIGPYQVKMRPDDSAHPNGRYGCTALVIDSYNASIDPNYQTKSNGKGMPDSVGCIGSNGGMIDFFNKTPGYKYLTFSNTGNLNSYPDDKNNLLAVQPGAAIFFTWHSICSSAVRSVTGAEFGHVGIVKSVSWTDQNHGIGVLTTDEADAGSINGTYHINNWRFTDTSVGGFGEYTGE